MDPKVYCTRGSSPNFEGVCVPNNYKRGAHNASMAAGLSYNQHIDTRTTPQIKADMEKTAMIASALTGVAGLAKRSFKSLANSVSKTVLGSTITATASKWEVPQKITNKFPSDWGSKNNKKGVGTRWQDPNNPGNGVRIDQGNPNHNLSSQQVDHVVVRKNGQVIGRDGKPIQGSIKEKAKLAHIPLSEYQGWKNWNSPR